MILMIGWAAFALAGSLYFSFSNNLQAKKRYWPFFLGTSMLLVIAISILFTIFSGPQALLLLFGALFIGGVHYYRVKFCDACGATNGFERGIGRNTECRKCGAELKY